jgi:8-oxo-dGTP pyrophosphatase MutT (NUDIX family)
MSAAGRNSRSRLAAGGSRVSRPSAKSFRLSRLRKLRECKQVAAVCYRAGSRGIEFLLVQTRGGRWTFPKGGAEPGLTLAQTAALEAFEEAGVHGRIEEASFTRYLRRELAVSAYLCEVLRLGPPQESKRNRTWFSAEKAKRRLREGRPSGDGVEFARVLDRAVNRIRRLGNATSKPAVDAKPDALRQVRLEAFHGTRVPGRSNEAAGASFARYMRRQRGDPGHSASVEFAVNAYLSRVLRGKVLRLGPAEEVNENPTWSPADKKNRIPQLTGGIGKVHFIDNPRGNQAQSRNFRNRQK